MITHIASFYWLVGILEGEGCFLTPSPSSPNQVRIVLSMTDEDVVAQVANLFNKSYYRVKARKVGWKDTFHLTLRGKLVIDFLQEAQFAFSKRRQEQIRKVLNSYDATKKDKRSLASRKLSDDCVLKAKEEIASGESLRKVAKALGVHHESLRRRIGAIV